MRIGVVSDSHGFTGRLSTILMVMEAGGPIDQLIHLGDGYDDLRSLNVPLPPLHQVAGNCDFFRSASMEILDYPGCRLLLTHGHHHHVKETRDDLMDLARRENANAVLYGHTHCQKMEWRSGILLLNPGAASSGQFAILKINALGAVDPELCSL